MESYEFAEFTAALGRARLADRPLPAWLGDPAPIGEAAGYRCQAELAGWLTAHGQGPHGGYKIGATTTAMQQLIGVRGPIYGHMLAANLHDSGTEMHINPDCRPALECELSFRLGADLDPKAAPFDAAMIAGAVDTLLPSIELVENRYGDYRSCELGTMVADDFFHKACILGPPVAHWRDLDLADVTVTLEIDGRQVETGNSRTVMGHPLRAIAWLANKLAEDGRGLTAGHLVMTGTVTPAHWLQQYPAAARMRISGGGDCAVTIDSTGTAADATAD